MPYTETVTYTNNGIGTGLGATPSTSPPNPTVVSGNHFNLVNGPAAIAIPSLDEKIIGTKYTFDQSGSLIMHFTPDRLFNKLLCGEPLIFSSNTDKELYFHITNTSVSIHNLTSDEVIGDLILYNKRKPYRITIT